MRVLLGSFRLDRPVSSTYHEILVGDPSFHVNRIHVPSALRGSDDAVVQQFINGRSQGPMD